jgi:hypothetical protein
MHVYMVGGECSCDEYIKNVIMVNVSMMPQ